MKTLFFTPALCCLISMTALAQSLPTDQDFAKGEEPDMVEMREPDWVRAEPDTLSLTQVKRALQAGRQHRNPVSVRIERAIAQYRETGKAPIIELSDALIYPYGKVQQVLVCAITRVCIIKLEAGEVPADQPLLGDTERWKVTTGFQGDQPFLAIKPWATGVETNLVQATNRRMYHITLVSEALALEPGQELNPRSRYMREISFYYPEDAVQGWERSVFEQASLQQQSLVMPEATNPSSLAFIYACSGNKPFPCKEGNFPFGVEQAYFAGGHTFIHLSQDAEHAPAPVVFVKNIGGQRANVNYNVHGRIMKIQGRPDQIELVIGQGMKRKFLIFNRGPKEAVLRLHRVRES